MRPAPLRVSTLSRLAGVSLIDAASFASEHAARSYGALLFVMGLYLILKDYTDETRGDAP